MTKRVVIPFICTLMAGLPIWAQTFQGGLRGTVTDSTGAPIPTAIFAALVPTMPPPRITTFAGATPGTPPRRMPRPPLGRFAALQRKRKDRLETPQLLLPEQETPVWACRSCRRRSLHRQLFSATPRPQPVVGSWPPIRPSLWPREHIGPVPWVGLHRLAPPGRPPKTPGL